jgi:hypothetical protein
MSGIWRFENEYCEWDSGLTQDLKFYKASSFTRFLLLKATRESKNHPICEVLTHLSTDMRFLRTFSLNNFKIPHLNFGRVRLKMDFVDREAISEMAADYVLGERVEAWLDSIEMAGSPPFDGKPIPPPGWLPPEETF